MQQSARGAAIALALAVTSLLALPTAHAALVDRGGGLIYDTDLDVTWLQDANYAQTSGYDADGLMTRTAAIAWADQLVYGGYSNWRLPTTTDVGLAGCANTIDGDECAIVPDPSTSEMAHLFYLELGNLSGYFPNGNPRPGGGLTQSGPFTHLQVMGYWSGSDHIGQNIGYGFDFVYGVNFANFTGNGQYAMAVSDGDIGAAVVPLPASGVFAATSLVALLGRFRRRVAKA